LTACWVRAELDDRMRLNNWSIAASYDTARIFAGLVPLGEARLGRIDFDEWLRRSQAAA
jgi:hypothetical protein